MSKKLRRGLPTGTGTQCQLYKCGRFQGALRRGGADRAKREVVKLSPIEEVPIDLQSFQPPCVGGTVGEFAPRSCALSE